MEGFAGFFVTYPSEAVPPEVRRAIEGTPLAVTDPRVALGGCLAGNHDHSVRAAFHGKLFNAANLRGELIAAGRVLGGSDAEIVVHGYEQWGLGRLLERLDGRLGPQTSAVLEELRAGLTR